MLSTPSGDGSSPATKPESIQLTKPMSTLPKEPRLVVPIEVFYFDTDAAGVVNNIAYLRFVEMARTNLASFLGWSLEEMSRTGLVPVVARTEIDYLRPIRLGDVVHIHAELIALEKIRMRMRFEIKSGRDASILFARCQQTMVTVQLSTGRPQRVPPSWRENYPQLGEE